MRAFPCALFAPLVLVAQSLSAQRPTCPSPDPAEGAVVGRVVDADTGVPLGFTHLEVRSSKTGEPLEGRSDRLGWFRFCAVPPGPVTLVGRIGQLDGQLGPLDVAGGASLEVTVRMQAGGRDTGTLTGVVVDAGTGDAVEGASLLLPDLDRTTVSNALGRFTLPSLPPGVHALRIHRLGYADGGGEVEIEGGQTTETRVSVSTEAIALEPITVTAVRRRIELPGLDDFERRYHSGWGEFVLPDDIHIRNPTRLTQMFMDTGVDVGSNGTSIIIRRTRCAPMVYIDGVKITHLPRGRGPPRPRGEDAVNGMYLWPDETANPAQEAAAAVNLVEPSDALAVEIYRGPAETPGQYIDSNSRCGVILIWTRRGRNLPIR